MKIDVEFFGIAIIEGYKRNKWQKEFHSTKEDYEKVHGEEEKKQENSNRGYYRNYYQRYHRSNPIAKHWQFYFVLDLGVNTKKPMLLWAMSYKNPDIVNQLLEISGNAGIALLNEHKVKRGGKLPIALQMVTKLKVKFFGNNPIPIKRLTIEEWENRYKILKMSQQKIPIEL